MSVAIPDGAGFRGKIPNWRHESSHLRPGEFCELLIESVMI